MNKVIQHFYELSKIPRCSTNHEPFIKYIQELSNKYGFECYIDDVKNILCKKKNSNSKICMQSHYDMVCLLPQEKNIPEIIEEDGFLRANNTTLGADNGIGCSYMLTLMEEGYDCEYLFTSDEEIGLIGANDIKLEITSPYMLNLDSEEEDEICIGCAGGVDIFGENLSKNIVPNKNNYSLYEITIDNLKGGHSGIEIHKEIPNAIKLITQSIKESNADLIELNGGQRINSIPKSAKAIIASKETPLKTHENMHISKIDTECKHYTKIDSDVVDFLYVFSNGVRGFDINLGVVLTSINLAIVETTIDGFKVELSARSMDNLELEKVKKETLTLLEKFGFNTTTNGKYPAWKPDINEFTKEIELIAKQSNPNIELRAIHAGLECAIFKSKFEHIKVASIGPNIISPHSSKERVEIASVNRVYEIVKNIIKKYS